MIFPNKMKGTSLSLVFDLVQKGMAFLSQARLLKSLNVGLTLILFGLALWFSRDILDKFQSKATNFKQSTDRNTGNECQL